MRYWPVILKIKKNSKRSFTLVETLVVVTIFSIIAVGLAAAFVSGMKLWGRAQNINLTRNDMLIVIEKVTKELHQSLNLPLIGFEGKIDEFAFPDLIGNSIVKIIYKFDPEEKVLLRRQVGIQDIIDDKADENYSERKIISLDEFTLSYLYFDSENDKYAWADTWAKDKGIFSAVKLKAKIGNEELIKTIFIPIA